MNDKNQLGLAKNLMWILMEDFTNLTNYPVPLEPTLCHCIIGQIFILLKKAISWKIIKFHIFPDFCSKNQFFLFQNMIFSICRWPRSLHRPQRRARLREGLAGNERGALAGTRPRDRIHAGSITAQSQIGGALSEGLFPRLLPQTFFFLFNNYPNSSYSDQKHHHSIDFPD